jgi:hypothetical protein
VHENDLSVFVLYLHYTVSQCCMWVDNLAILTHARIRIIHCLVRLEVSTVMTVKNIVFWDVASCGSGATSHLYIFCCKI